MKNHLVMKGGNPIAVAESAYAAREYIFKKVELGPPYEWNPTTRKLFVLLPDGTSRWTGWEIRAVDRVSK